ncbi:hypothetical protein DPMN_069418 [Dreissena polymorpha]|uniref:Uncharacterized protein n=1 Tax=Dreissena polymorpha TaxID=45954 RepID=A0A9D4BUY4_DREPO|nr:hypothetical protein DPMN_069418 [Dreissena polymorpha]
MPSVQISVVLMVVCSLAAAAVWMPWISPERRDPTKRGACSCQYFCKASECVGESNFCVSWQWGSRNRNHLKKMCCNREKYDCVNRIWKH